MSFIKQDLKVYFYWGSKGSGKSLVNAVIARELFESYLRQEKKYPSLPKRRYYSKTTLSKEVEDKELNNHLFYWRKPYELYDVRNADISWDEIQNDLPTGGWKDTHPKTKAIFSHLRKRGNRLFANAQIYEDVDISFRRQIDYAFHVKKYFGSQDISASLPPPKRLWGLVGVREYDPKELETEKKERQPKPARWAKLLLIRKKHLRLYDTTMEVAPFQADTLEHREYVCVKCRDDGLPHYKHTKIEHYKI